MGDVFTTALLPGLTYRDEYVTRDEEQTLLSAIDAHPHAWKSLHNRRLQNWGGLPHIKGMIRTPLPHFVQPVVTQLRRDGVFAAHEPPDHVLVNRYAPGQGIDAHVDGPAYKPTAAIVSLLAPLTMQFYKPLPSAGGHRDLLGSLVLRPRSLLVLTGSVYHDVLHAIAEREQDELDTSVLNRRTSEHGITIQRQVRVSLTVRAACRTITNPLLGRVRGGRS